MRLILVAVALALIVPTAAQSLAGHAAPATAAEAAPAASAGTHVRMLPTPGFFCDLSEPLTGRLFPEAEMTNDFVAYEEALCGLNRLAEDHPDRVRLVKVGESVGWESVLGGHDTFDVFVVEVTHFDSAIPFEDKPKIVFQVSIHGNEKGGREGGLRVIEDFARDIGMAAEHPETAALLDLMGLVFVFPNPDGWTHEEVEYRHNDACYSSVSCGRFNEAGEPGLETQGFVRVNGHGVDINREWPTVGWQNERHTAMSEPEAIALSSFLKTYRNVRLASDIHGMLNPADMVTPADCMLADNHLAPGACDPEFRGHFVLTMLPAGRQSPWEMAVTTTLAGLVKERLNSDPYFVEWQTLPGFGAWGGEYNDWGTVWDTLGYTDSGFTSDWYAQDIGLNVPGVDFELAYNHITFDNYYPGVAQRMNGYHIESVREIVRAFMDQAASLVGYSVETNGKRTAYLANPVIVTNEANMAATGWAQENPADDAYDTAHRVYRAAPDDYWHDLKPYLREGDAPGVLDALTPSDITTERLASYDNLVVAGSAYDALAEDEAALAAVKAFVEAGGTLLLTDHAIRGLAPLGLAPADALGRSMNYAGYTNFVDKSHELVADVRGLARETFEPVPLGFDIHERASPVWNVSAAAFEGEVIGVAGRGQAASPLTDFVTFGRASLGSGSVVFLGALLPDPSDAYYHPYGLDSHSVTYTGNQLVRNVLGWTEVVDTTPLTAENALAPPEQVTSAATATSDGTARFLPAAGLLAAAGALGAGALARRARRER